MTPEKPFVRYFPRKLILVFAISFGALVSLSTFIFIICLAGNFVTSNKCLCVLTHMYETVSSISFNRKKAQINAITYRLNSNGMFRFNTKAITYVDYFRPSIINFRYIFSFVGVFLEGLSNFIGERVFSVHLSRTCRRLIPYTHKYRINRVEKSIKKIIFQINLLELCIRLTFHTFLRLNKLRLLH